MNRQEANHLRALVRRYSVARCRRLAYNFSLSDETKDSIEHRLKVATQEMEDFIEKFTEPS